MSNTFGVFVLPGLVFCTRYFTRRKIIKFKSKDYYFNSDAIKEKAVGERRGKNKPMDINNSKDKTNQFNGLSRARQMLFETRNKRSVWTVKTKPYKESHFAVFPKE